GLDRREGLAYVLRGDRHRRLARLAMRLVLAGVSAGPAELDPGGVGAPGLSCDVVSVLVLPAWQGCLGPDGSCGHGECLSLGRLVAGRLSAPASAYLLNSSPCERVPVAEAGLEPATQRL